jgi:hypothetical protein
MRIRTRLIVNEKNRLLYDKLQADFPFYTLNKSIASG